MRYLEFSKFSKMNIQTVSSSWLCVEWAMEVVHRIKSLIKVTLVIAIFFSNATNTPPILMSYWDADSESDIKNLGFEKLTAQAIGNI